MSQQILHQFVGVLLFMYKHQDTSFLLVDAEYLQQFQELLVVLEDNLIRCKTKIGPKFLNNVFRVSSKRDQFSRSGNARQIKANFAMAIDFGGSKKEDVMNLSRTRLTYPNSHFTATSILPTGILISFSQFFLPDFFVTSFLRRIN